MSPVCAALLAAAVSSAGHVQDDSGAQAIRTSGLIQPARSIEILDPEFRPRQGISVLGTIAAGAPIEAVEHPEELAADEIIPEDGERYALRVRGDSMIEDAICDGDMVVVERQTEAVDGQTVVAILPGEQATLKRYYREPEGRIRLQPANSTMQPLIVNDVEIRGVVRGLLRQY